LDDQVHGLRRDEAFIALLVPDLEKSAKFYAEVVGLPRAPQSPPGAVLFLTSPIPFALRQQPQPLGDTPLGLGVALWFLSDDSAQLHAHLKARDVALLEEPTPGPFGWTFRFRDLDGYVITVHDKA
jgi:predicted enzyme related to lactoylglutathione lyase